MRRTHSTDERPRHDERTCPGCGAATDLAWSFCGECGSALLTTVGVSVPHQWSGTEQPVSHQEEVAPDHGVVDAGSADRRSPRRSRGRVVAVVVAVVLLCAAAGGVGYWQVQQERKLSDARAALDKTRSALAEREASLEATRGELADAEARVSRTSNQLTTTRAQLSTAREQLSAARQRADGLEGSLDDAEDRLDLQAGQIETLKSCLNGVLTSLAYIAADDYGAALASLEAVQVSCQRSSELF